MNALPPLCSSGKRCLDSRRLDSFTWQRWILAIANSIHFNPRRQTLNTEDQPIRARGAPDAYGLALLVQVSLQVKQQRR
ncbi:hypothetical protein MHYP_G00345380 [Metynnis hypsauchen]